MKQISLANSGFELATKKTRKREFLEQMERIVPWGDLVREIDACIKPVATGRPRFETQTMLRIHFLQLFFGLSDPAMEEALHDMPLYREFARLDPGESKLPDESTILRFRHFLEKQELAKKMLEVVNRQLLDRGLMLRTGTVVDATIIEAPSSTKNAEGQRDPEMHQTKKGNAWHFGMKAHIGVDEHSGLVHTVTTTAANVHDVTQAHALLHGEETDVFADSGYRGVEKREEIQKLGQDVKWHIAMMPSQRNALDPSDPVDVMKERLEAMKASVRAKVEHPFQVIKCVFGFKKVRFKGLAKNTDHVIKLFALSNLWMVRKHATMG